MGLLLARIAGLGMELNLEQLPILRNTPPTVYPLVVFPGPRDLAIDTRKADVLESLAVRVNTLRVARVGIAERDRIASLTRPNASSTLRPSSSTDLAIFWLEPVLALEAVVEAGQAAVGVVGLDAEHGRGDGVGLDLLDLGAALIDGVGTVDGADLVPVRVRPLRMDGPVIGRSRPAGSARPASASPAAGIGGRFRPARAEPAFQSRRPGRSAPVTHPMSAPNVAHSHPWERTEADSGSPGWPPRGRSTADAGERMCG